MFTRKLDKGFEKRVSIWLLLFLILGIAVFLVAFLYYIPEYRSRVFDLLEKWGKKGEYQAYIIMFLKYMRSVGRKVVDSYGDQAINYTAILESAVIFFYGVSDNKRIGVPFRTIISYSFGSYSIPVLFVLSLVLTLLINYVGQTGYLFLQGMIIIYILVLQLAVIVGILISTSVNRAIRVVVHVEKKQYKALRKLGITTYMHMKVCRHMEQAFCSDELIHEKMRLAKKILMIPLKVKKIGKNKGKFNRVNPKIQCLYGFYYYNILTVLQHFKDEESKDIRNVIYQMLYEFVYNLKGGNKRANVGEADEASLRPYEIVISGIMNAVQFSKVPEAREFCDYMLENCIPGTGLFREKLKTLQMDLFVLYQEVLSAIGEDTDEKEKGIDVLNDWKWNTDKKQDLCFFWCLWMKQYSIKEWKKGVLFLNAIKTMDGHWNQSRAISREMMAKTQERRG